MTRELPDTGASAALFALAAVADGAAGGSVLAVEQATVALAELAPGAVPVHRDEAPPRARPVTRPGADADIAISLAAYERAFEAKLRLVADQCTTCGTLAYPARFRCLTCGSEARAAPVALPRQAVVYTLATIHVPVPGLSTPYTVVLAELGDSAVRLLVRLTGADAGSVAIGDRGRLVFRRVAVRTGVPDYGYAFFPRNDRRCGMRRVAMVGAGMTPFGELFGLGIKDMVPMAVGDAVASVDKGFDRSDIEAAWFGELVPSDGFASGILADSCGLLDIPVSRLENACATGNDAVRHGILGVASGCTTWSWSSGPTRSGRPRPGPPSGTGWA